MDISSGCRVKSEYNWKKLIFGSAIGNVFELYDFILYACLSSTIAIKFFPPHYSSDHLFLSFLIFACGCFMRPAGAILFGFVGDKYGRKKALVMSIILISISTTFVGLLPTYDQIGISASYLLIFCRLAQGLSMSGEEVGASVFLIENSPENKKGFASSIILGSVYLGLFLCSIAVMLATSLFSQTAFNDFGWRLPFLLAFVLGLYALTIRLKQPESKAFEEIKQKNKLSLNPIREIFLKHKLDVLFTVMISSMLAVSVYLFAVYFPGYILAKTNLNIKIVMMVNILCFLLAAIWTIQSGCLSDLYGAKKILKISCYGFMFFGYPIFWLLTNNNIQGFLLADILLIIFLGLCAGSLMPILMNFFPANLKFIGVAIGFNSSMTIFGSLTPIFSVYLTKITSNLNSPALCLLFGSVITLIGIRFSEYTIRVRNQDLESSLVIYDN